MIINFILFFSNTRTFGSTKLSLSERNRHRLSSSFESLQSASERTCIENNLRKVNLKQPYHVGNVKNYTLNKKACIEELTSYEVNKTRINFTELA